MAIFRKKGEGKGLLGGLLSTVVGGVSGIVKGVVSPLSGAASDIIKSATPLVKEVANSPAGVALASGVTGGLGSAASYNTGKSEAFNSKGFFDYKKDDGALNWGKIALHATGVGLIIGLIWYIAS